MVGACARLFFLRVWFERSVRGPLETETGRTVETTVLESTILIGNVIILGVVRPHVRPPVRPHPASLSAARPEVVPATGRPRSGRVPVAGLDSSGRVAGHLCRTRVRPYVSLFSARARLRVVRCQGSTPPGVGSASAACFDGFYGHARACGQVLHMPRMPLYRVSVCRSVCISVYGSICLSVCLCVYLSVCLTVCQ